ncbi:RDD family protein [Terribacillus saccharophilus]|uniref:RDD family protein n=1 Tax=Terribacillus saccharophilus TaxID=361277 RepID=A0A268A966_9BACI|nr:RDD family protein [Terribacillus saccharophilus]PAD20666.1 RDD family protein [Terribacillus saccharophilus]PAF34742.1 RDD family protein [Terribacillus saccharophilus]
MNEPYRAGFGIRFFASIIDMFILIIPISILLYFIKGEFSTQWSDGYLWDIGYVIYLTVLPVLWKGYVIGKRLTGIKIKRKDGGDVTFANMILREVVGNGLLVYVTFGISLLVSAIMVLVMEDRQGLHDLISGTYVVYSR